MLSMTLTDSDFQSCSPSSHSPSLSHTRTLFSPAVVKIESQVENFKKRVVFFAWFYFKFYWWMKSTAQMHTGADKTTVEVGKASVWAVKDQKWFEDLKTLTHRQQKGLSLASDFRCPMAHSLYLLSQTKTDLNWIFFVKLSGVVAKFLKHSADSLLLGYRVSN